MRMREVSEVPLNERRMLSTNDLAVYLSLGRNKAVELAMSAGATVRIGRRIIYDRKKLDAFLDSQVQSR